MYQYHVPAYQYHVPTYYQYHVPMGLYCIGLFSTNITSLPTTTNITSRWDFIVLVFFLPISRPCLLPISRPDGTFIGMVSFFYQYHVPMGLYCIGLFSTNITSLPTNITSLSTNIMSLPTNITSLRDFIGLISFFYQYHVPLYQYHVPTYQYHVPMGLCWNVFFFLPISRPDGTLLV